MSVLAKDQIALMARYHAWATERLLESVAPIPEESYRKPCGLFFGSIHGTLNHLLVAESEYWYPRFTQRPVTSMPLDAELESDRTALASRLTAAATQWGEYVESLDETALAGDLRFTAAKRQARVLPMSGALLHVFNHATHHRGQITAAFSMLGFEYQPLDLHLMIFAEV